VKPAFAYKAVPIKVIDGDTIDFKVDLGFHTFIHIRTRLQGVDTPELRGETFVAARDARDFVKKWLNPDGEGSLPSDVIIATQKDPGDKYGRWLARVWNAKGQELAEALAAAGHAKPYDGGAKP
jgi:micrococcal nuclease